MSAELESVSIAKAVSLVDDFSALSSFVYSRRISRSELCVRGQSLPSLTDFAIAKFYLTVSVNVALSHLFALSHRLFALSRSPCFIPDSQD